MSGCGKRIKPEQYCAWRWIGDTGRFRVICSNCRAALRPRTQKTYLLGRAQLPGHTKGLTCGQVIEKGD